MNDPIQVSEVWEFVRCGVAVNTRRFGLSTDLVLLSLMGALSVPFAFSNGADL